MTDDLLAESAKLPSWTLSARQLCDLELLLNGGFSPLTGFLTSNDYDRVCSSMRLANGVVWPIPITLSVSPETARAAEAARSLALRDEEGTVLAVLRVEDAWRPDREAEAEMVFGTANRGHAGVKQMFDEPGEVYLGGQVEGVAPPAHYDFVSLRYPPADLRKLFAELGWRRIVAFQTRNPLHRAHYELIRRAMEQTGARLLIHPAVGATREGDVDHYTRVRCYRAVIGRYPPGTALLSLLPIAMRMAGPREAVWHAIVRKNYGCTHFIVGRDHAGPGSDASGRPWYQPEAAVALARSLEPEIGIAIVGSDSLVYLPDDNAYVPESEVPPGKKQLSLSGTELRDRLKRGREIPEWFTFPEVARELRRAAQPAPGPGTAVLLTGFPSSGKSTIARNVAARLMEEGSRPVTLLDGDLLRRTVSKGLGFSRADREEQMRRVGTMAADIVKQGGIAICSLVAPYDNARRQARALVAPHGRFLLVHVATPLEVCERRDPKGLYAQARAGTVKSFTGMSDPYEEPTDAEVTVDTSRVSTAAAADRVLDVLETG